MKHLTPDRQRELYAILQEVAVDARMEPWEIVGKSHMWHFVMARRDFAARARNADFSLTQIARAIGRHHTSILSLLGPRVDGWKRVVHTEAGEFTMFRRWKVRFECGHETTVITRVDPTTKVFRCRECSKE